MAIYTKNDVQNALADLRNGVALATAATHHSVSRNTLRSCLDGAQSRQDAHETEQRLSVIQEEHLERWILRQKALGYTPTHDQIRGIASNILKRQGDHRPLRKKWSKHFVKRHSAVKTKLDR
jgi:hypothetical protein